MTLDSISYNTLLKLTPSGEVLSCCVADRSIFRASGWVSRRAAKVKGPAPKVRRKDSPRGARRAKKRIFELAACNDFDTFVTWTLDPEKINRFSYKDAVRALGKWLDNRVQRRGLRYLVVAEHHDNGAIHFHGLCNSEALRMVDSGRVWKKKGRKQVVYNLADWDLGFTTAVKLEGDYTAVCHYISKYITKQTGKKCGGRWYLHGGKLQEPVKVYGLTRNFEEVKADRELEVTAIKCKLKYIFPQHIERMSETQWQDQPSTDIPSLRRMGAAIATAARAHISRRTQTGSSPALVACPVRGTECEPIFLTPTRRGGWRIWTGPSPSVTG